MKKNYYGENLSITDKLQKNDISNSDLKTTDVNVLLNRVRLEKKKTFNKRILFSFSLVVLISLLAIFLIVQS